MSVETATYISDLNASYPASGDPKSEGDNHLRLLKSTVKATFPNVAGAVTPTHTQLNYVTGVTSAIQTQLDAKAPTASPTFTGTPAVPTATLGTNTTQIASTAFVQAATSALSATIAASESAAATSASNAATQASNALTSANNAAASYDAFDDRYLGSKTSNPTLDNDGNALLTGALYWNSVSNEMRTYNGSAWVTTYNTPTGSLTSSGYTMSTARLIGRTTASTGATEEITVGSGLSLSAGTLSASASSTLNGITAATGANTIANGDNAQTWQWSLTTAAKAGFKLTELAAATGGSGSQFLLDVGTLSASTANPFRVQARGVDAINVSNTGAVQIGPTGTQTTSPAFVLRTANANSVASGDITLSVGNVAFGSAVAGTFTINGGQSTTTQSGNSGGIVLTGGAAGAVASVAGGPIVLTSGAGSTTTTGGVGGALNLTAGAGGLAAAGGAVTISGGAGGATGSGGAVTVQAGARGSTGAGSNVNLTASNGSSGVGGDITLTTGTGSTNGAVNFVNTNVANGSVATTITSLGPTGASTTIVGWLKIKVGGTTQYIPYW